MPPQTTHATTAFRFAEESDLPALMAVVNAAFEVESFFKLTPRLDEEMTRDYFRKGRFLIAEHQGALAGCVYIELHGERGYMGLLSVDPKLQKTGLGQRMAAAAEEFAREMGAHRMELTVVNLRAELLPLYERYGYREIGTEPIPEDMARRVSQPCHFIRMAKPLGNG